MRAVVQLDQVADEARPRTIGASPDPTAALQCCFGLALRRNRMRLRAGTRKKLMCAVLRRLPAASVPRVHVGDPPVPRIRMGMPGRDRYPPGHHESVDAVPRPWSRAGGALGQFPDSYDGLWPSANRCSAISTGFTKKNALGSWFTGHQSSTARTNGPRRRLMTCSDGRRTQDAGPIPC